MNTYLFNFFQLHSVGSAVAQQYSISAITSTLSIRTDFEHLQMQNQFSFLQDMRLKNLRGPGSVENTIATYKALYMCTCSPYACT